MTDENRALLAHLFRRAAFGATKADLNKYEPKPYATAVSDLLAARPTTNPTNGFAQVLWQTNTAKIAKALTGNAAGPSVQSTLEDLQTAWVQQMVTTGAPLFERMVLFLSNHFATAYTPSDRIDVSAMARQQGTIRTYAVGSFKDLAHAMLDDLALGLYLNANSNMKGAPNENLARELMELFVLGAGHYTEDDVREAARALTGYEAVSEAGVLKFKYNAGRHDNTPKTVLGTTANFTPHTLLDLLFSQPGASQFLANKLVTHFVSIKPDAALVSAVAQSLARDWNLTNALKVIFLSSQFKSSASQQQLVKTPTEYVVGIMRALGRSEYRDGAAFISGAGQELYRPPSVAGWPQGQRLLGAGAMIARYNAASKLAAFHMAKPSAKAPTGPDLMTWSEGFGMTSLLPTTVDALTSYANATGGLTTTTRIGGLITLLASSPDFNLS